MLILIQMVKFVRWILISIISLLLISGCILGNREGIISGTVINSAGEPISGVELSIASVSASTTSDSTGYFILSNLKVGNHDIVMKKTGYAATTTSVELTDPGTLSCATPTKTTKLTLPLALTGITGLIFDLNISSNNGYDFSETSTTTATLTSFDSRVISSTSNRCDVYLTYIVSLDKRILTARNGIQDSGYKNSLDDVGSAPTTGYIGNVDAIHGHCYIIRTIEGYYAKLRVDTVTNSKLYFFWALQPATANTQFSTSLSK